MNTRLFRSPENRILLGVCGGLAEMLGKDPAIVRIVFALLVPFTGGFVILLYLVMAFVVPERPVADQPVQPVGDHRWDAWERQAASGPQPSFSGFATNDPGQTTTGSPGAEPAAVPTAPRADLPPLDEPATAAFAPGAPIADRPPAPGATSGVTPAWPTAERPPLDRPAWEPSRAEPGARGGLILGLILVLVGAFFLARSSLPSIDWDRAWPLLLVGIGVVLLLGALRRSPRR